MNGLEELRKILEDDRLGLSLATVTGLRMASDRSVLRAIVNLMPEGIEVVARMSWESVGPEAGVFQFPSVNDLVIVGFLDGEEDDAYVIKRLTSREDKIPMAAVDGNLVMRTLPGKKAFVSSDTEINLVRGDEPGDEQLVLGNTFKEAYSTHLQETSVHTHVGNLGYLTAPPMNAAAFTQIKTSPVDDDLMLSDLAKTEK